ncbi:MAG: hypothetical protein IKS23_03035 [Alphaproteobacteria bacterium]|nr:hypothetical protein [Alphaproteobacteria bacterium]
MKKNLMLTLLLALFTSFSAKAEVQFLPEAKENMYQKASASSLSDNDQCKNAGYIYTSCEGAMADECPYRAGYYKICCPAGYLHKRSECTGNISSDSCAGYYKCDVDAESACTAAGYHPTGCKENSDGLTICYAIEACETEYTATCPYDSSYIKCIPCAEREGYFRASNTSNPCNNPSSYPDGCHIVYTPHFCQMDMSYVKCVGDQMVCVN